MAEAGAKVLNAQAVEWARRAKIALDARRTSDPLDAHGKPPRETVAADGEAARNVRAVVGLDKVVAARVKASALRAFADLAGSLDVPFLDLSSSGDEARCAIPLLNVPDWERCRAKLEDQLRGALVLTAGWPW